MSHDTFSGCQDRLGTNIAEQLKRKETRAFLPQARTARGQRCARLSALTLSRRRHSYYLRAVRVRANKQTERNNDDTARSLSVTPFSLTSSLSLERTNPSLFSNEQHREKFLFPSFLFSLTVSLGNMHVMKTDRFFDLPREAPDRRTQRVQRTTFVSFL